MAAAGNTSNQVKFMQLMGLVDDDDNISISQPPTDFPVEDEQLLLLQTAIDHTYYPPHARRGKCDGHYTYDQLISCVPTDGTEPQQCKCIAHRALFSGTLSERQMDDLKDLIRSPARIASLDEGNEFILALLRRLIHLFKMPYLKVSAAGRGQGVSYVLLHQGKKYCFAGYPDFVRYQDDYGAQRILILTGEIQSTRDADTQNSIYGVGSLLNRLSEDSTPIICITIFKRKYASLALARLDREGCKPNNAVGAVSLKYVVSPVPIDLLSDMKTFAYRLFTLLKVNIPGQ